MKYKPYSFSKIETYNTCPRKFKYRYIDKIPVEEKDREPLLKGSAVHNILEKYPDPGTHSHAEKYYHIVQDFLDSDYKKLFSYPNKREIAIALDDNLEPVKYSKDTLFRGYIDYMFIDGDVLSIVDWKTGKFKEQRYQNFNQLLFYSIYVFKKYSKIEKIKIRYIYVEHKLENSIELHRKYLDNYVQDLLENLKKIENDVDFPKKEQVLCRWCDYQSYCLNSV